MSAAREKRQIAILELIKNNSINTQEELTAYLNRAGYKATQATVSRDIKDLGLVKTTFDGKNYRYSAVSDENKPEEKILNLFKSSVISIVPSFNLVVIKTLSGSANTAALFVDSLKEPFVLGTVAGDDTILIVVSELEKSVGFAQKLNDFIK